jgi:hypothetical protein
LTRSVKGLNERRRNIESLRAQWPARVDAEAMHPGVSAEITESWSRSRAAMPAPRQAAPLDSRDPDWKGSPLSWAAAQCLEELSALVRDGGMVAAISDAHGKLLWTAAGAPMQRRAEKVNFVPGAHWDEPSAGTNALAMSLHSRRAATVFSSEHFMEAVSDWVCYAAPITQGASSELVGVIDLSTTWDSHNPLGLAAARGYAERISAVMARTQAPTLLGVRLLGEPQVAWQGESVKLSLRQLEILCLLVLHPDGLDLGRLHAELYGEQPVLTATLKAEVSKLREVLPGVIGSRPYRLLVPVDADFVHAARALESGRLDVALKGYRGPFLPRSESPGVRAARDRLEFAYADAVWRTQDCNVLLGMARCMPHSEDASRRLLELLPRGDARREMVVRLRSGH